MVSVSIENVTVQIAPFAGYRNRYFGEEGVVEKEFCTKHGKDKKVGVRLNNHYNSLSKNGLFWFDADKVNIVVKGIEPNENCESEDTNNMLKGFRTAYISFLEGTNTERAYAYALYGNEIEIDDIVVVQSGHHGLGIARVVDIAPEGTGLDSVQCGREIIAKVDFTAFKERKEKAAKLERLKKDMDRKVKELQSFAIYEMLAEKDPELKAMLDEFKGLNA